jgi:hypothetical protein
MSGVRLPLDAGTTEVSTAPAAARSVPQLGVGRTLRVALADFYEHSWRLVLLNGGLSAFALIVLAGTQFLPLLLAVAIAFVALGPPAIALMHCAVTIVETGDLQFADFVRGIRLHWRRGIALGSLAAVFVGFTATAIIFYGSRSASAWPLAFVVLYLAGMFGVFQLALWPLSVVERGRPLGAVLRHAAVAAARRPRATVGLGAALLLVNLLAIAAAVLPFATMTIAYTSLAAARFFVPRRSTEEV